MRRKLYLTRKNLATLINFSSVNIFVNEELTPENHKVSFHCQQIKHRDRIKKKHPRDGVVQATSPIIS